MKFKFCGGIDCPEWLITEITYINKINAVKLRIICTNICAAIISDPKKYEQIYKMLEEIGFSEKEGSIIISVLHFILKSSIKFDVDLLVLNQELQQLGLPQENADSIAKVLKTNSVQLKSKMTESIFTHDKFETLDWKINYILADNICSYDENIFEQMKEEEDTGVKISKLETKIDIKIKDKVFTTNKELLGKLINDLERASNLIKKYN